MKKTTLVLAAFLVACGANQTGGREASTSKPARSTRRIAGHPGVFLLTDISESRSNAKTFLAEAPLSNPTCKFEIRIEPARETGSAGLFQFTRGALAARKGSACSQFLHQLGAVLAFKGDLPHPPPTNQLPVAFAVMSEADSRFPEDLTKEGSFAPKPPGAWFVSKLFVAEGEGEVYLNLNPQLGVGEFSQKDPDYANVVITELSKVLPH